MKIRLSAENIKTKKLKLTHKTDALPGVKRAAAYVCGDLEAIFSVMPDDVEGAVEPDGKGAVAEDKALDLGTVYYMTDENDPDLSGRRECYKMQLAAGKEAGAADLYITGSDKRGTIY